MKKYGTIILLLSMLAQALPVQRLVQQYFFGKEQAANLLPGEEEPDTAQKEEDGKKNNLLTVVYSMPCTFAAINAPHHCTTYPEAFCSYSYKDVITPPPDGVAC